MFFGRLMMEHMLFIEARLMPAKSELSKTAEWYRRLFETVLHNAAMLGNNIISTEALSSGEMVTPYTHASEQLSQFFTNVDINQDITIMQEKLRGTESPNVTPALISQVKQLNANVDPLIHGLIEFKHKVLVELQACKVFIADYPLLVRNMMNEAVDYHKRFAALEHGNEHHDEQDFLLFWKQGMLEHVITYRNMFDPTEKEMIAISDGFAQRYSDLMLETRMMNDALTPHILAAVLKETIDYRNFSETIVKRIVDCELQSAMFPQMADHALREINYFVRLLKQQHDVATHLSQQ